MKTVREIGQDEDLTFIYVGEQMQIAQSMGIEVGGADRAELYAVELTEELGLDSGGAVEEATDDEATNDEATRISAGGMLDFNLDPSTFSRVNPTYQDFASSSNANAEKLLGLVHIEKSMLHAKEALNSILEGKEDDEENFLLVREAQLTKCLLKEQLKKMKKNG